MCILYHINTWTEGARWVVQRVWRGVEMRGTMRWYLMAWEYLLIQCGRVPGCFFWSVIRRLKDSVSNLKTQHFARYSMHVQFVHNSNRRSTCRGASQALTCSFLWTCLREKQILQLYWKKVKFSVTPISNFLFSPGSWDMRHWGTKWWTRMES